MGANLVKARCRSGALFAGADPSGLLLFAGLGGGASSRHVGADALDYLGGKCAEHAVCGFATQNDIGWPQRASTVRELVEHARAQLLSLRLLSVGTKLRPVAMILPTAAWNSASGTHDPRTNKINSPAISPVCQADMPPVPAIRDADDRAEKKRGVEAVALSCPCQRAADRPSVTALDLHAVWYRRSVLDAPRRW